MSATLWDILLCILIDENVEEKFWEFAKKSKLLSKKQIAQRKPDSPITSLRIRREEPYILAATNFAKSPNVSQHVSQKILRNIKNYYERN